VIVDVMKKNPQPERNNKCAEFPKCYSLNFSVLTQGISDHTCTGQIIISKK